MPEIAYADNGLLSRVRSLITDVFCDYLIQVSAERSGSSLTWDR